MKKLIRKKYKDDFDNIKIFFKLLLKPNKQLILLFVANVCMFK